MYRAISRNPVTNPNYYSKGYNIHKFDLTDFYGRFDTIRDAIVEQVEGLKPHVKILSWAPQNDILSHNKTILFFTHGGLKSVKEGICSDTAMLFLPFFADQPRNALFARELGVAEFMYKKNITVDELSYKIHKVLDDSNYDPSTIFGPCD
ncbi:hypothetical protein RB195_016209 [Necator americanus]|uniref:glucuronosyltransferase n=1 Tax=Necator americanus TaxID=51031 RepID=A0ABR1E824_NECAM